MGNFWKNKKILITGSSGFVGRHLVDNLIRKRHVRRKNLYLPTSKELDLRIRENCRKAVKCIDIVIHLAGVVGGIGYNRAIPGKMFFDNLIMGIMLMEEARLAGVGKVVNIGTVCSYPKFTPVPFKEEDLWSGYPEETNAPYGLAKKMLLLQSQAYREQYGFNSIFLIPVNMYGPGDKYNPKKSHVIPALIKKVIDAKKNRENKITVWGTGKPTREFLYVEDAVEGILLATERYNKSEPVNLGSSFEISIKDLVVLICELLGFKGKIVWDKSKPDGQPRRKLDTSKAKKEFNFEAKTDFKEGLKKTIDWYKRELDS